MASALALSCLFMLTRNAVNEDASAPARKAPVPDARPGTEVAPAAPTPAATANGAHIDSGSPAGAVQDHDRHHDPARRINIAERYVIVDPRVDTIADVAKPAHERLETLLQLNRTPHQVNHDQDKQAMLDLLRDSNETDTIRHEILNFLHGIEYPAMHDLLQSLLDSPREKARFRAFCVQHLWEYNKRATPTEQTEITSMLRELLEDEDVPVQREALLALVRNGDPRGGETALHWLREEDNYPVTDLAIRCVKQLDLKEHIPTIRTFLTSTNEPARIAAIVALSEWGDQQSFEAFKHAAESKSTRIKRAGKMALKRLDH